MLLLWLCSLLLLLLPHHYTVVELIGCAVHRGCEWLPDGFHFLGSKPKSSATECDPDGCETANVTFIFAYIIDGTALI